MLEASLKDVPPKAADEDDESPMLCDQQADLGESSRGRSVCYSP
jgi:hypothetical protein